MLDIACIILTKDEEIHLERCITSARKVCSDIWVIDSYSTDRTCEIAEALGAHVVQHTFTNQAEQFNWAIDHLPITNPWIWRLDADEIISDQLAALAKRNLPKLGNNVNGVYVNKRIIFMEHPLRFGGWYPAPQIKLIRRGFGRSEDKVMDEHLIVLEGETVAWDGDQVDWNLRDLDWWWNKHLGYAKREAQNMLQMEQHQAETVTMKARFFGTNAERKRWLKEIYAHSPMFVRPIFYFLVRYLLMGGFLDGYPGWYWHTRQGLHYRMLVDCELSKLHRENKKK